MEGVYFLVPTLLTIAVSMLIVRGGAIALMMTGMRYDHAKFQALSAFSGTGFTTREAERVVNNPRRRRIVTWLMVLGNAGIVTLIVTGTSSFSTARGAEAGINFLLLVAGVAVIYTAARHTPLAGYWEDLVQKRLARYHFFEDDRPLDELLHLTEGFGVVRIQLPAGLELTGHSVAEINAGLEDSVVLGIERDGQWYAKPGTARKVGEGDTLVIYGKLDELRQRFG